MSVYPCTFVPDLTNFELVVKHAYRSIFQQTEQTVRILVNEREFTLLCFQYLYGMWYCMYTKEWCNRGIRLPDWLRSASPAKMQLVLGEISVPTSVRDAMFATLQPFILNGREHIPCPPLLLSLRKFNLWDVDFVSEVEAMEEIEQSIARAQPRFLIGEAHQRDHAKYSMRSTLSEDSIAPLVNSCNYWTFIPELLADVEHPVCQLLMDEQSVYKQRRSLHTNLHNTVEVSVPITDCLNNVSESFPFANEMCVVPLLLQRMKSTYLSCGYPTGKLSPFEFKTMAPAGYLGPWEEWGRDYVRKCTLTKPAMVRSQFANDVKQDLLHGIHLGYVDVQLHRGGAVRGGQGEQFFLYGNLLHLTPMHTLQDANDGSGVLQLLEPEPYADCVAGPVMHLKEATDLLTF